MMTANELLDHLFNHHGQGPLFQGEATKRHAKLHTDEEGPLPVPHQHVFEPGMAWDETLLGKPIFLEDDPPTPRKRVSLRIVWLDGHQESVPAEPGWRIDAQRGLLIVGRGIPRMQIPLVGVRWYMIEHPEEKP